MICTKWPEKLNLLKLEMTFKTNSNKIFTNVLPFADKSTNLYQLAKESYKKLLHSSITQTYRKAPVNPKRKIDRESKKFAKNLNLQDRMECYSDNHAYITLKDRKVNFRNNIKCRLINPSKSEVGLVSKCCLTNIVADVSKKSKVNQWRNMTKVIDWFKKINENGSLSNLT